MTRTKNKTEADEELIRKVSVKDGSHWAETYKFRILDHMTRGDIFWFVLGHLLLLPIAAAVLLMTALCLPLYYVWHKVRQARQLPPAQMHGEVQQMMADPRVHEGFCRGREDVGNPLISVVMPLYNREKWVDWAIGSLLRQDFPKEWDVEIIAVDNGSTDGTIERLRRHPVRIIECTERGPGAARNAGIAAARAPYIAFTDSDCVADTFWLQNIAHPLMEDPELLMTGGEILAMQVDDFVATFTNEAQILNNWRFFNPGPYFPRFFATANMACRRDAAVRIGGFDNHLWMSEDADFCWRLMELGGKMEYRTDAVIYHQHRGSLPQLWRQAIDYGAASVSIFAKHRNDLDATWAIAWKNIRDIAWSPFEILWDQFIAEKPYDRKDEILYCLWRLGFTVGSVRECLRRRVFFL